ncbi:MAG TPA: fumarylacetoacetase, partial [bacterium]|nr:fumarylacetoacetase [bacterium]
MLHSWIDIPANSDFPLQNLPWGVFETPDRGPRACVAIGDYVLDLYALSQHGFLDDIDIPSFKILRRRSLNAFIRLGRPVWRDVRQRVQNLLRHDATALRDNETA